MISLEVALLVLNGFAAGKLTALELFWPFVRPGGGVLLYYLTFFTAAVVAGVMLQSKWKNRERGVFWVAAIASLLVILIAGSRQLAYRSVERQPQTDNDGVVQGRVAAEFLLHGKNPYDANYRQTDFGFFPSPVGPAYPNLANDHYAYLPLQFLLMVPSVWLNQHFGTQFDVQLLYLALFLLYGALLVAITPTWRWRTRILLLTVGNPWLWTLSLAAFNDILPVVLLVGAAVCVLRRWPLAASVVYGLALASKQTVWLTIPLWVGLVWWAWAKESVQRRLRWLGWAAMTAGLVILPFFFWNPGAFYDDVIRYVSGAIPFTYPLSGHTFLQYLRVFGLVDGTWTQVTAWPFQLVVGGGLTWLGLRAMRLRPTAETFLWWAALVWLGIFIVSRFAPDNYFLAAAEMLIAAYAVSLNGHTDAKTVD